MENEIGRGLVAHHEGDEYRIGKPSLFEKVPLKLKNMRFNMRMKERQSCIMRLIKRLKG